MTRARSGSFYCPVEPTWAPLSLDQKAALSTANKCNPNSAPAPAPAIRARRQFREAESVESANSVDARAGPGLPDSTRATAASQRTQPSGAASQCPIPVANPNPSTVDKDSDLDSDSESTAQPQPKSLPRQRFFSSTSTSPAAAAPSMTYATANAAFTQRHAYSPRQPSPLRRQANEKVSPSALWTTHTDLLAFYQQSQSQCQPTPQYQPRKRHSRSSSAPNPMLKTVLKNGFLAGPMAEKARMYGLRVAWCVFGDVRDVIGRDMFSSGNNCARRPPHRSAHSVDSAGFVRAAGPIAIPAIPSVPIVINVTSVTSISSVTSVPLAPRGSKRQSYPTASTTSTTSTSRLRRSPSSLVMDTDPIDPMLLDDGDEGDADAIVLEHSEDVQLGIDEKVAEWEKEVQRRALENPLGSSWSSSSSSGSSSSSSSYEEDEPSTRLFRVTREEDPNEDSDESDSIYDDCSDEELHFISDPECDDDYYSDSDSDSSESAESLDDEAEVERDVFSILERTILGVNQPHHVSSNINTNIKSSAIDTEVNVDVEVEVNEPQVKVTVGSPPTPWELPFVGFVGDL